MIINTLFKSYTKLTVSSIIEHVHKRGYPAKKILDSAKKVVEPPMLPGNQGNQNNQGNPPGQQNNNAATDLQTKDTPVPPTTDLVKHMPKNTMLSSTNTSQAQETFPPKFKNHEYTLDDTNVKYALQKGSEKTSNQKSVFVDKEPSKDLFPVNLNATSHHAWTSSNNSSNFQSVKDDFDPAQEALKLAVKLNADVPASLTNTTSTSDSNTSNTSTTTTTTSIHSELLGIQKATAHPPLKIPQNTLIPDFSDEKDLVVIKKETFQLSEKLSDKELMVELVGRGIIKVADDNTTKFKTISGETIIVGESKNNIKITPFGRAYVDLSKEKDTSIQLQSTETHIGESLEYKFAVLAIDDNAFLLEGVQKHIIIGYDRGNDIYYIMGYLTSQNTATPFAKQQFKIYQDAKEAQEESSLMTQGKPQFFTPCRNFLKLKKDQMVFLKWDQDYLRDMGKGLPFLNKLQKQLCAKSTIPYNAAGYSKETLIQACINFDNNIRKKKPHPKTDSEMVNEQKNKEIKEQLNKEKSIKKALHKDLYAHLKVKTTPFDE
jgi:hypothetical protein